MQTKQQKQMKALQAERELLEERRRVVQMFGSKEEDDHLLMAHLRMVKDLERKLSGSSRPSVIDTEEFLRLSAEDLE
jgi:hypothetical protein